MLIDMPHLCNGGFTDGLLLFKREPDEPMLEVIQNTLTSKHIILIMIIIQPATCVMFQLSTNLVCLFFLLVLSMCGCDSMTMSLTICLDFLQLVLEEWGARDWEEIPSFATCASHLIAMVHT